MYNGGAVWSAHHSAVYQARATAQWCSDACSSGRGMCSQLSPTPPPKYRLTARASQRVTTQFYTRPPLTTSFYPQFTFRSNVVKNRPRSSDNSWPQFPAQGDSREPD
ncbi:hypothetical protein J6590_018708 [Homalodisca vitripennis]|nr:hypothetical protein J6590_018708 [Homalodisca vitripennis]